MGAMQRIVARARRIAQSLGSGRREAAIALCAYLAYNLVRGLFGGTVDEGLDNAADVIALEREWGMFVEGDLQRFFSDNHLAMPFWNFFYPVSQVVVLPLTLFLVYRYRRSAYPFLRNLAILSWSAGLVWYAVQPVAPPRRAGVATDTVSDQTFVDLGHPLIEAFYNPVAAMPSLHVGLAPVVAWALWSLTDRWWTRALGLLYPILVAVSIVVTGNHYVLDIAGGLVVVIPAAAVAYALTGTHVPVPAAPRVVASAGGGSPT